MKYNFDLQIDRHGTNALKTDALAPRYGSADLLPLWVADMDFATPDFIIDAMKERLSHPIFGYTMTPDSYYDSVINWVDRMHDWKIRKEWITFIPGIVTGIGLVLQAFTEPGDKIIIQPPVYHPFRLVPEHNGREIVNAPLTETANGYKIDLEAFEAVIDDKCKVFILCNPHNPGGIVWDRDTLEKLAEICSRRKVLVISDEIHSDLALWGHKHIPFASVSEQAAQNSITFMAPSKTFNMAGIISSVSIVPNDSIRRQFYSYLSANELNEPHIFALVATQAAYDKGEEWLGELKHYLEGNIRFMEEYMHKNIPSIRVVRPQASFLVWLDCRKLKLSQEQLVDLFVNKAGLALNDGAMFGQGGTGFMRLNVGTPKAILEKALEQLARAINS